MRQGMMAGVAVATMMWVVGGCSSVDEVAPPGCLDDSMCRSGRLCQDGACVNPELISMPGEAKSGSGTDPMSSMDMEPVGPYLDMPGTLPDMPGPGDVCLDDRRCELCVSFTPQPLDFGVVLLAQRRVERFEVSNCSQREQLYIRRFGLEGDAQFELSAWSIGDGVFALAPGDEAFVEVVYEPISDGMARAQFLMDVSTQQRGSASSLVALDLFGDGRLEPADNQCPVSVATGQPADRSQPAEKTIERMAAGRLLLDGTLSYDRDPDDKVEAYQWSLVESPPDVRVVIDEPSSASTSTTLRSPGDYLFRLRVFDRWGRESCSQAEVRVNIGG